MSDCRPHWCLMRSHKPVLAGCIMLAASLPTALVLNTHTALAGGTGAAIVDENQCFDQISSLFCFVGHAEYNNPVTPSGNISYVANGRLDITASINGRTVYHDSLQTHVHSLTVDGLVGEFAEHYRDTFTYQGQTCTLSLAFHNAGGAVQYDNYTFSCSS